MPSSPPSAGRPMFVTLKAGGGPAPMPNKCDYLKLIQRLNVLHQEGGGPFEALDLPAAHAPSRSLLCRDHTCSTRTGSRRGSAPDRGARCARNGGDLAWHDPRGLARECVFTCIINTNSPLQLDIPMAEGLIAMAEHGQCNVITPFTLAGAMSPVTIAGALAQQHAEAMAGIVLAQIVRPGARSCMAASPPMST